MRICDCPFVLIFSKINGFSNFLTEFALPHGRQRLPSMASLKMYPAGNGDSFLIEHGTTCLLVDGGYSSTFQQHVLPDLRELARRGRELDLVVATHIDADHIAGLVRLLAQNGSADAPQIVGIRRVWHNSLRCLVLPLSVS